MKNRIHRHSHVAAIQQIHEEVLGNRRKYRRKKVFLEEYGKELWEAYGRKEMGTGREISNHHPACLGRSDGQIFEAHLNLEDMRLVAARAHGDESWENVEGEMDHEFEDALDLLLDGDEAGLEKKLNAHPRLATAQSSFAHRATLLHHLAANGTPIYRQQVPLNAPAMLKILLRHGADSEAIFHVYGGNYTTAQLIPSSAHPNDAGIATELLQLLNSIP